LASQPHGTGMMDPMQLPDFQLETYFSKWEFTAEHHLTASDAESMSLSELLAFATEDERAAWDNLHLGYTPTWGTPELRSAVSGIYRTTEPEDILAFAGAGEALFWAMQLAEPGDHVIVTVPNYQSIESIPVASGVEIDGLPLWSGAGADLRWTLDLDRFASLVKPNTTLVSVNFPNNPTGFVPDHATWKSFNDFCHERGIRVVSDEVYRGVELNPTDMVAAAVDVNPSALSISVTSKAYGLPGLRVGWLASRDRAVLSRLERAKHYTSICNAGPSEHLTCILLRNERAILEKNRQLNLENDRAVHTFMDEFPELFQYQSPVGGCVAFPRWTGLGSALDFCTRAVEEHGVFLLPNSVYASSLAEVPTDRFRIGIGRRSVPASLDVLRNHVASL